MLKDKERAWSSKRKATCHIQGILNKTKSGFLSKTLAGRRQWDDIFKAMKEKYCQLRILYSVKLSFKIEGQFETFPKKQKLRNFITTRSFPKQTLKEVHQV